MTELELQELKLQQKIEKIWEKIERIKSRKKKRSNTQEKAYERWLNFSHASVHLKCRLD